MNYFTKEWYKLCQKTSTHLLLEEEQGAENFSEEYFNRLYNQKLKEWLDLQKEVASCSFESFYPKEMSSEHFDENMSEAEVMAMKASFQANREKAKENYNKCEPFNIEKESEKFHKAFLYNQEHIKEILPEEILNQIADIRVFALGKASQQLKKAATQFCENNQRLVDRTLKEYQKCYEEVAKSFDKNMVKNINFHDCKIIAIKQTEQMLTMLLDNSGGFTDISQVRFENYKIFKQDSTLEKSWWLYDEIYRTNDKYELHVLLHNESLELEEFIVSFESISFIV